MIWYLDSSVILQQAFDQPGPLDLGALQPGVSSRITELECYRAIDRGRHLGKIPADELPLRQGWVTTVLSSLTLVEMDRSILALAGAPMPVPLGTLDGIHLASALHFRGEPGCDQVTFATHDRGLAAAARAYGFPVVGA